MSVTGIDCSHFQGSPPWNLVKATAQFAILKATEGRSYEFEEWFREQFPAARSNLPVVGAYHFLRRDDGAPQADYFLSVVGDPEGIILALDFESYLDEPPANNYSIPTDQQARDFAKVVNKASQGLRLVYGQGRDVDRLLSYDEFADWQGWPVNPQNQHWFEQVGYITIAGALYDHDTYDGTLDELKELVGGKMTVDEFKALFADAYGIQEENQKAVVLSAAALWDKARGVDEPNNADRKAAYDYLTSTEGSGDSSHVHVTGPPEP